MYEALKALQKMPLHRKQRSVDVPNHTASDVLIGYNRGGSSRPCGELVNILRTAHNLAWFGFPVPLRVLNCNEANPGLATTVGESQVSSLDAMNFNPLAG